jgi:hypothetical protein
MKSAVLPQVRIEPALRANLEAVLVEGETLSTFVESSVRRAAELRHAQRNFDARCGTALKDFLATGLSHGSDTGLAELRQRTETRRTQLQSRSTDGTA